MGIEVSPLERLHQAQACLGLWAQRKYKGTRHWELLKEMAPEGLRPVVVIPSDGEPFCGFMFDRLSSSVRIVVQRDKWKIVRVRRSSEIVTIQKSQRRSHRTCCGLQGELFGTIERILSKRSANALQTSKRAR